MKKLRTLDDILKAMSPSERKRVLGEAKQISKQYDALKALRLARSKTQAELARELSVTQPYVAKLERKSDLMLSMLRKYIRGVGGELELSVVFPDTGRMVLSGFGLTQCGDDGEARPKAKRALRPSNRSKIGQKRAAA